jgi:hypothetical protein
MPKYTQQEVNDLESIYDSNFNDQELFFIWYEHSL